ncbi:antigen peptide transporter 1 isoform X3 [Hypanus sabinus]|uniref:antigen peptide transporter 1 isoform X3 n=1 Tax=Hypanus sabinus TaxID=79690 RepID=UPI0028C48AEF|nr:antigen peptide transporter 1 isoform X3 [Hypanus sabinus]
MLPGLEGISSKRSPGLAPAMAVPRALLCLAVLDVAVTWVLSPALQLWGAEPLLALWASSLVRLCLLSACLQPVSCLLPGLTSGQLRDLRLGLATCCLLLPTYTSLLVAVGCPCPELLHGSCTTRVLALSYLLTGLGFTVNQRFLPEVGGSQTASLTRLVSCLKPDSSRFLLVAVFLVLSSAGEMAVPYYSGRMTDWVMNKDDPSAFSSTILAMAAFTIGSAVSECICDCIYNATMMRIHTRIQGSVFKSVVHQDIAFFDTQHTGDITSRITTDTNTMSDSLSEQLSHLMWCLMRVMCLLAFMLSLSFKLSLFTLALIPFITIIPEFFAHFYQALLHVYPHVKKAVGASEKVFEYMDRKPAMPPVGTLRPTKLKAHIEFRNVTFAYPKQPDVPVLKNVSFEVRSGEVTALAGASAAGKTTCVSLLQRFYQPQSGQILLDGIPIEEYEHKYYHSKVALVSQEPVLFARSVEENIAYGLEDVSTKRVANAARDACAHQFITALKDGYSTDAGEKGGQLSGGQKQRVAIARALIRDPQVLILDDATSCLDNETEHMVHQSVYSRAEDRAVLVIAHRPSTMERADRIVVLEGGNVVEEGTPQQLQEKGSSYHRLLHMQSPDVGSEQLEGGVVETELES